jgi:hypothetical protein
LETKLALYREALLLLLIREDLSDEQIYDFQWKIDQFAQGWFQINMGDEGVTNYVHDLHAGHISDYLFHWRNLYTHSQQGWENMNFAIKNTGSGVQIEEAVRVVAIAYNRWRDGFSVVSFG